VNVAFQKIRKLIESLKDFEKDNQLKYRIIDVDENASKVWSHWITNPTGEYLDFGSAPIPFKKVNEIQIDPVEERKIGNLVSMKKVDHTEFVCGLLEELNIIYAIEKAIILIR